jgi:hypothetical protein
MDTYRKIVDDNCSSNLITETPLDTLICYKVKKDLMNHKLALINYVYCYLFAMQLQNLLRLRSSFQYPTFINHTPSEDKIVNIVEVGLQKIESNKKFCSK